MSQVIDYPVGGKLVELEQRHAGVQPFVIYEKVTATSDANVVLSTQIPSNSVIEASTIEVLGDANAVVVASATTVSFGTQADPDAFVKLGALTAGTRTVAGSPAIEAFNADTSVRISSTTGAGAAVTTITSGTFGLALYGKRFETAPNV